MAKESVERKDPVTRRSARLGEMVVTNQRPDRAYLFANPNDNRFGVATSEALGWKFIDRNVDKERARGGGPSRDDPSKETYADQILMYMQREDYEAYLAESHSNQAELSARIARPGGIDAVAGTDKKLASGSPFGIG
jgi:hypothetical protein